ncbi:hypothetical protein M427DRAFT_29939 [Gonapodya prolifera JEL478]|uniref:Thioredoxin domain-containing protein n=1 Tax=Gonapodya prolifera (strain JEL478) TaxID=1344416 RepID=A0A139AP03_GONPJ|nr:hypothetical protein M427DRAFT_29939 [Gonapodya prolifera JEL478]|eukprot:KXS18225.1 hypothetical protein M427DRAFT_29939 [Gonapodya prolifera JEL478]
MVRKKAEAPVKNAVPAAVALAEQDEDGEEVVAENKIQAVPKATGKRKAPEQELPDETPTGNSDEPQRTESVDAKLADKSVGQGQSSIDVAPAALSAAEAASKPVAKKPKKTPSNELKFSDDRIPEIRTVEELLRTVEARKAIEGNTLFAVEFGVKRGKPCQVVHAYLSSLTLAKLHTLKVDHDRSSAISHKYNVSYFPTVKFWRNGVIIAEEHRGADTELLGKCIKKLLK